MTSKTSDPQTSNEQNGWNLLTPTWTGSFYKKRTFWQWLTRKPRQSIASKAPTAQYKQVGDTVHYTISFTDTPKPNKEEK